MPCQVEKRSSQTVKAASGCVTYYYGRSSRKSIGPLLFLVYRNDLPEYATSSKIFLFADDTKCLASSCNKNPSAGLQANLDLLSNWSV